MHERGAAHPRIRCIGKSVRRAPVERPLAGATEAVHETVARRRPVVDVALEREDATRSAQSRGDDLERALDLVREVADVAERARSRVVEQDRSHDLLQLVGRVDVQPEHVRSGIDDLLRRIVADEALRELERDVTAGARMLGDAIEERRDLGRGRRVGRHECAEHGLLADVVPARDERLVAVVIRAVLSVAERPARQRARHLVDVGIDVADRHPSAVLARGNQRYLRLLELGPEIVDRAERVQLADLACVVLVEARRAVDVVVEEIEHRRRLERRLQHRTEVAEHVLAQDIAVPRCPRRRRVAVVAVDVEMVVPEIGELLDELPATVDRAHEHGALAFADRIVAHVRLARKRAVDLVVGPELVERLVERDVRGIGEPRIDLGIDDVAVAVERRGELLVDERGEALIVGGAERVEIRDRRKRSLDVREADAAQHVRRERRRDYAR